MVILNLETTATEHLQTKHTLLLTGILCFYLELKKKNV